MSSDTNNPSRLDAGAMIEARAALPAAWHEVPSAALESGPPAGGAAMSPALVWHTWRRWWHFCLPAGVVLAALGVVVVWFTFSPVFEAAAWLEIRSPQTFVFETGTQNAAGGTGDIFVRTQLATITSPFVLERVISREEIGRIAEIRSSLDPLKDLAKGLKVKSVDESELYQVSYACANAQDAQAVVNAVLTEYLGVYENDERARRQEMVKELETFRNSRRVELSNLREKVRQLAKQLSPDDAAALGTTEFSGNSQSPLPILFSRLGELELQRAELEARLSVLKAESNASQPEVPESLVQSFINNHPEFQRQQAVVEEADRSQRETMAALKNGQNSAFLESYNNRLKEAKEELAVISARLAEEAKKTLATEAKLNQTYQRDQEIEELASGINAKLQSETLLKKKISDFRASQNGSNSVVVELEFTRGDLARVEQVYNLLLNRISEIETEDRAPSRVAVRQDAKLPSAPMELMPWRRFGVTAGAGLFVPFVLALLWEFRAQRISASDQLSSVGSLPLFGEITALPTRPRLATASAERGFLVQRAAFEDSVHYLCRSLLLSAGDDLRVVAITSAVSGEGKTSLSAQLAISLAQCCHENVILVDADVRAPDMHEIYDVPLSPGLAEVMLGESSLRDAIHPTAVKNVHLLPAGLAKSHPHLLLHHDRMQTLLKELQKKYRYVVLDTPPVLAVGESLSVCKMADGVLICALRDVTRQPQLQLLQQRLRNAGAKALGIVLGGVSSRSYAARYGDYAYQQDAASAG